MNGTSKVCHLYVFSVNNMQLRKKIQTGEKILRGELMSYAPIKMVIFQIHAKINVYKEKVQNIIDSPLKLFDK